MLQITISKPELFEEREKTDKAEMYYRKAIELETPDGNRTLQAGVSSVQDEKNS
jgi:hypothetical protein